MARVWVRVRRKQHKVLSVETVQVIASDGAGVCRIIVVVVALACHISVTLRARHITWSGRVLVMAEFS